MAETERSKHRRFDDDYKAWVVARIRSSSNGLQATCRELNIPESTVRGWIKRETPHNDSQRVLKPATESVKPRLRFTMFLGQIPKILAMLPIIGLLLYSFALLYAAAFSAQFDVTPDQLGLNQVELLTPIALVVFLAFLLVVAVIAITAAPLAVLHELGVQVQRIPSSGVMVLVGGGVSLIVAGILSPSNPLAVLAGFGILITFFLVVALVLAGIGSYAQTAWRGMGGWLSRGARWTEQHQMHHVRAPNRGTAILAVVAVVFFGLLVLANASLSAGTSDALQVKAGACLRKTWVSEHLMGGRGAVTVDWQGAAPAGVGDSDQLVYLGENEGITVLYDAGVPEKTKSGRTVFDQQLGQTLLIPSSDITIRIFGDGGGC